MAAQRSRRQPFLNASMAGSDGLSRKGRYAPPVHMIRLTETQEIAPYPWVHPYEER